MKTHEKISLMRIVENNIETLLKIMDDIKDDGKVIDRVVKDTRNQLSTTKDILSADLDRTTKIFNYNEKA